ncbi:flippase [Thermoflexus sp.]|uniref:flippase n=1 Tax=Thermoflexus sp. TaxID=1969742 RepID=UPI003332BC8B
MSGVALVVIRNALFGLGGRLAIKALAFAFSVWVVRRLGQEAYGLYATALAYVAAFAVLSDWGLAPYLVREIARDRRQAWELLPEAIGLRFLLATGTIGLILGVARWNGQPAVLLIGIALASLTLILYAVQGPLEAALQGLRRLDLVSAAGVVQQILFVGLGTGALLAGMGFYGLIGASLIGLGAALGVTAGAARAMGLVRIRAPRWRTWPLLLRAGLPFGLIGLAVNLSYKVDTILLSLWWPPGIVGWYSAAYNLIFSIAILSNAINVALYPSMAALTDPVALGPVIRRALGYLWALSIPFAVGGWILADRLIPALYGPAFVPSIPAFRVLMGVVPLMFLSEYLGYVILVRDREWVAARSLILSTAFNVTANLILIPRYGLMAAAWITVLTELLLVGQYAVLLHIVREAFWDPNRFGKPLLAAATMGVTLWMGQGLPLPALVAVGGLTYGLALWGLGVMGPAEWRLLGQALRRAPTLREVG